MKLSGDYTFEANREVVWESLLDPEVLAAVLPGCEKLELIGDNEYEATLNIKVGPVQGSFHGKVKLEDIRRLEGYTMQVEGRGPAGFVNATAQVLVEDDGGRTRMSYESDARVGGKVASVGQRLLEASAKAIVKQSLEGLNAVMVSRTQPSPASDGEGQAAREDKPTPSAPSPAGFAAAVAKEVASDLIPGRVRWAIGIAIVVVFVVVAYMLIT